MQETVYPWNVATASKQDKPATSADVAAHAGLSRSTVSAILNGNTSRFPEATVKRVQASAAALDYTPSIAGRALVRGNSGTVVILLPNATFGTQVQDLSDRLMEDLGTSVSNVVVRFFDGDLSKLFKALRILSPIAVVNFGALPSDSHRQVSQQGFLVLPELAPATAQNESAKPASYDRGIGPMQLAAMSDRANRTIAFAALTEKRTDVFGPQRFDALKNSCTAEGLPEPLYVSVDPSAGPWIDGLEQLVNNAPNRKVGIVCYNDDVALAVLAGARELGFSIPEHVSIVGMDGTNAGQLAHPQLTSVSMDLRRYADYLASVLIHALGSPDAAPEHHSAGYFSVLPGATTVR